MNKAVFFDKDGVINIDKGILKFNEPLELYPDVADIIEYLREKKYLIIIVTNQPVVARGLIDDKDLKEKFSLFKEVILKKNKRAIIDNIYYCPHHPNADKIEFRKNCDCRKPKPGMLLKAGNDYNIDLKNSYMIGDRSSDIIAGYLAGCKTILCMTGKHNEKMIETDLKIRDKVIPNFKIKNIIELKKIII